MSNANEITLPTQQLSKLIDKYNTEKSVESVELEILYKNKKKINDKTLKRIHSYFNKNAKNSEILYILDISLLTGKNKRLSRTHNEDFLEEHCEFEKKTIKEDSSDFPKKYNLEEKEFITNVEIDSIDSKINLKTEKILTDDIQKNLFMSSYSKINKTYRYKKRSTYQFENYRVDISLVKTGKNQNIFLADIDSQIEEIELEIEYTSKSDLTMEVLKDMIKKMTICNQIINEGYFNINIGESSKIINQCKKTLENVNDKLFNKNTKYIKLGPKPVSLTKNTIIKMLEKTGHEKIEGGKKISVDDAYKITVKADGERYYMYIDKESKIFLVNGNDNVIITGLQLNIDTFSNSILDGELIIVNRKYEYKYFDIYVKQNEIVYNKNLNERIEIMNMLDKLTNNNEILTENCVSYIEENKYIRCSVKEYKNITEFDNLKNEKDYKIDGVIFMYNDRLSSIQNKTDMSILKYKPLEQNSIDVLLLDNILYCSFVSNRISMNAEIACSKPYIVDLHKKKVMTKDESKEINYEALNNKIIEIVYYPEPKDYFVLEKIRHDKTIEYLKKNSIERLANNFNVVNDIIGHSCNPIEDEYLNELNVDKLINLKNYIVRPNSYYVENNRKSTKLEDELKNIQNKIKRKLINNATTILKNNKETYIKVLEIACGRGGEIPKYISTNFEDNKIHVDKLKDNGIKFVLGIDIDTKNIEHIGNNDERARGRFIKMKNEYIKSELASENIPSIYKNNSAYFMSGDLNNYDGESENMENTYVQIMSNLKHNFNIEYEDNNLDFEKRTEYDMKMLKDINTINKNINLFEKEQFELISCQFAIHYLNLDNFCKYVNLQLKQGGIFICTFMEKTKVLKLLGDDNEKEGEFWGIRKNEEDPENKIDVKFKTANNKYMTEQFMTLDLLKETFEKYNINLYSNIVESVQSNSSSIKNIEHFADLPELKNKTDKEFEFNKLYTGVIFQKNLSSLTRTQTTEKIRNLK